VQVGDLVIYKGMAVGWYDEYDEYLPDPRLSDTGNFIPGVVIALYCICNPGEERWWLKGGCQCVADILWAGDSAVQGHVTKHLEVCDESRRLS